MEKGKVKEKADMADITLARKPATSGNKFVEVTGIESNGFQLVP